MKYNTSKIKTEDLKAHVLDVLKITGPVFIEPLMLVLLGASLHDKSRERKDEYERVAEVIRNMVGDAAYLDLDWRLVVRRGKQ